MKRTLSFVSKQDELRKLIDKDDVDAVGLLLDSHPALLDGRDSLGYPILHKAISYKSEKVAVWLIENKPQLMDTVDRIGSTVLHIATRKDSIKIVELLLEHRPALIDKVDEGGNTALNPTFCRNSKIIELLLKTKPTLIDAVDNHGNTILHQAIQVLNKTSVGILQIKVPIDEVLKEFFSKAGAKYLAPFKSQIIEHCKPALSYFHSDISKIVCQYISDFDKDVLNSAFLPKASLAITSSSVPHNPPRNIAEPQAHTVIGMQYGNGGGDYVLSLSESGEVMLAGFPELLGEFSMHL